MMHVGWGEDASLRTILKFVLKNEAYLAKGEQNKFAGRQM